MAAPTFLNLDDTGLALDSWQLCKSLSIAQTAPTATILSQNIRDAVFVETTFEFIDVSRFEAIRVQVWGVAADNDAPVIDLYGWSATGPGAHIGKVTLAYGAFTSAATTGFHAAADTHKSIRNAFAAATAYRGCDTYTVTNDYEAELVTDTAATPIHIEQYKSLTAPRTLAATSVSPVEANLPGFLTVNFARSAYKYFGIAVTTLAGTTLGAIFRPVKMRERL